MLKRLYPYLQSLQEQPSAYLQAFFRVAPGDLSSARFSHLPRWELTSKLKSFLSSDVKDALRGIDGRSSLERSLPEAFAGWDGFSRAQFLEATGLLPGYLLSSQGDRMAMAHGVEGRFPFLDHRLVELTARIPPHLKMKVLDEKYILKRAAGHLAPSSVLRRTKQPYRAPDAVSFFDPSQRRARAPYVDEALSPGAIRDAGLFDPTAVGMLVDKARNGRTIGARDNMALVGVLSAQLWHDQFIRCRGAGVDASR